MQLIQNIIFLLINTTEDPKCKCHIDTGAVKRPQMIVTFVSEDTIRIIQISVTIKETSV